MKLTGIYTALVTPFTADGKLDEPRLRTLVETQLAGGVDGLVPCGTTGESPTLDHAEHNRVIEIVVDAAAGRGTVIAGTGSNSTAEAIAMTQHAREAGADVSLQVAPYYNKPTQAGLDAHFRAIAEEGGLPLVIYNIPGRTGIDVADATMARLRADLPERVVGLKEATGNVDRVSSLRARVDAGFAIFSGDDALTLPMMSVGAVGLISVASNVAPQLVAEMVHAALRGDFAAAGEIHARLYPLFKALFIETNPIPVKAAVAMLGQIVESYRLPLVGMSAEHRAELQAAMAQVGLRTH